MKKLLYILAISFLASCSGTVDPVNPDDQNDPEDGTVIVPDAFTEPFTLSADKTEVEANGIDVVTFSLKDAYDREMLDDMRTLEKVRIVAAEGIRVKDLTTTATFIANGSYNFTASYQGKKSNTVVVQAKNRAKYEVFHRNVGLFKCTSVWCIACPGLGDALHSLSGDAADHSVVISVHGNFEAGDYGPDPFALYVGDMDLGSYMMSRFGGRGWPTLIYDLATSETGAAPTTDITANILQRRIDSPATCGLKVTSVAVEGTVLKIKASMKTSAAGSYDMACAVLRDGLVYNGGYSVNGDGVYDEVLVAMSESGIGYYDGEELESGEEYSEEFTFDFGNDVPSAAELQSFSVAVYAHRKVDSMLGSVMDNIVLCRYGESVDYLLND